MPGCAVHLEIAGRVLKDWQDRPGDQPFPCGEPSCRAAFLFGSLAPDLGYFPGGDGLLADLAHCVRSTELACNLFHSAETEQQNAVAWGWVTHLLGDIWIHPLINQAAAERVRGNRLPALAYADDPLTHIQIELGLDSILPARRGWNDPLAGTRLDPGANAVGVLKRAYQQTYTLPVSGSRMRVANWLSVRFVSVLLLGGRVHSDRPVNASFRTIYRGLGGLARRLHPKGLAAAFTHPAQPPDWLIAESEAVVDSFAERFRAFDFSRLAAMPDYNLDTGEIEPDPPVYPLTVSALAKLERRVSKGRRT